MANLEGTCYSAWIATESPGEPVCLGGSDGGLSVTAYPDSTGAIKGVVISDEEYTVAVVGWIPGEVVQEELEYARDHV